MSKVRAILYHLNLVNNFFLMFLEVGVLSNVFIAVSTISRTISGT